MNYANQVDLLTIELTKLTAIVSEINKKIDSGDEKYHSIDVRLTVIETRMAEEAEKKKK